jgi:hypothetical protein
MCSFRPALAKFGDEPGSKLQQKIQQNETGHMVYMVKCFTHREYQLESCRIWRSYHQQRVPLFGKLQETLLFVQADRMVVFRNHKTKSLNRMCECVGD